MRDSRFALRDRYVDRPWPGSKPNTLCTLGLRMSASMIKTSAPNCASDIAVFTTVVVLPSPGWPLVTSSVFGGLPAADNRTDVLRALYASAADEWPSTFCKRLAMAVPGIVLVLP